MEAIGEALGDIAGSIIFSNYKWYNFESKLEQLFAEPGRVNHVVGGLNIIKNFICYCPNHCLS